MSVESNKQLIRDYFACGNVGDYAALLSHLSQTDFHLICRALPPLHYQVDKPGFEQMLKSVHETFSQPLQITIAQMTAEGDRVAVQASSRGVLVQGGEYCNSYHFLFTLRDGKIVQIEEYLCSFSMAKILDAKIWEENALRA